MVCNTKASSNSMVVADLGFKWYRGEDFYINCDGFHPKFFLKNTYNLHTFWKFKVGAIHIGPSLVTLLKHNTSLKYLSWFPCFQNRRLH